MDLKFKKLVLMSIKMNNSNRLKLKTTPEIIINRPFFESVWIIINKYYANNSCVSKLICGDTGIIHFY